MEGRETGFKGSAEGNWGRGKKCGGKRLVDAEGSLQAAQRRGTRGNRHRGSADGSPLGRAGGGSGIGPHGDALRFEPFDVAIVEEIIGGLKVTPGKPGGERTLPAGAAA